MPFLNMYKFSVCVCISVCVFVSRHVLFPSRRDSMRTLASECKIDEADFTDWLFFLPSNLIEEIITHPEALSANT